MRSFIVSLTGFATCISLAACSTTPPNEHYLDAGARQHIKTVDAVLIAKQDRIGADVERNATMSKLSALAAPITALPMFLDAGALALRSMKADKMVKPIREKLEGHDYPNEFRQQVRQSLSGTTLAGVDDFMIVRNEYPGLRGQLITRSDADAVLLVDMKYAFTPSFETLYIHSYAMLFPNHPELKQFQETPDKDNLLEFSDNIYRNQFALGISTDLKDASPSEHAAKWAELPSEKLVDILDQAALLMADTIARDVAIDDLESDLDLIPEGYALNTKYENFNQSFASIRAIDSAPEAPAGQNGINSNTIPQTDIKSVPELNIEPDSNVDIGDIETDS